MSQYQKGKTNLDFTEARDSEWHWHQLGHIQVCTSVQTDNHANTPPLSFYRPDALPAAQPTASKHTLQFLCTAIKNLLQKSCGSGFVEILENSISHVKVVPRGLTHWPFNIFCCTYICRGLLCMTRPSLVAPCGLGGGVE